MQESQIILHPLFPPHEGTARLIEPGMAPVHNQCQRNSISIRQETAFGSLFAAGKSGGLAPVAALAKGADRARITHSTACHSIGCLSSC